MTYLFNLILHQGIGNVPSLYLCIKGSRDKPINYRLVSLSSVMCCILESIIAEKLMDHLLSNNLLSDSQFGFLPDRFACTQLHAALNKWYNNYDFGINIHIVYTDISKTFDTVSHTKVLSVLKSYGIANNTFDWIPALTTARCQCL